MLPIAPLVYGVHGAQEIGMRLLVILDAESLQ
jgi:hypothetical protein